MPRRRLNTVIGWTIGLFVLGSILASMNPGGRSAIEDRPIEQSKIADPQSLAGHVTVWSWNIAGKGLRSTLPAFNKRYPKIDVDVSLAGQSLETMLLLSLSSGAGAPDVAQLQAAEAPHYVATHRLTDLTPVAAKYEKDFPAAFWANCVLDGHVYGIPWDIGPCGVFYKRDIFQKYGIDPDRIETWDDFIEAGKEILRKSNGRTRMLPMSGSDVNQMHEMLLRQVDGQYFDDQGRIVIHSPASRRVMDLLQRMKDSGICYNVDMWTQEWMAGFNADTIATYPLAVWLGGTIKDTVGDYTAARAQWGVFRMPAFERGGRHVTNLGGSVLVIPDQCPNKEVAWAFVEHALCTTEGQIAQYANFDLFPAYLPALEDPFFQEPDPFYGGQKVRAFFASGVKDIPILNRTTDWIEANNYAKQSFTTWVVTHEDSGKMLDTLAHKLEHRLGRKLGPVGGQR